MEVTVVIGTFGEQRWRDLAMERAYPSAITQAPTITSHSHSLAGARNAGANAAGTEWLCFLDADDQLLPGYFEAMAGGTADLRGPIVEYVHPGGATERVLWPARPLIEGNFLPIGTLVRRELFLAVGGFLERWPVYEDWCLWQRCWLAGALIEQIREAVYRAHVNPKGRNGLLSIPERRRWAREIVRHNFPEAATT